MSSESEQGSHNVLDVFRKPTLEESEKSSSKEAPGIFHVESELVQGPYFFNLRVILASALPEPAVPEGFECNSEHSEKSIFKTIRRRPSPKKVAPASR